MKIGAQREQQLIGHRKERKGDGVSGMVMEEHYISRIKKGFVCETDGTNINEVVLIVYQPIMEGSIGRERPKIGWGHEVIMYKTTN